MRKIKQSFVSIIIGLALAAGISYAAQWSGPTANPPDNNTNTPLNVGTSTQYKSGGLGIGGLFRAYSSAIFDGKVGIGNTAPQADLDVHGSVRISNNTQGDGKVLTSNVSGDASWQAPQPHGKQRFTSSGSGTFTVPSGVTKVWVSMAGGGGGGGGGGVAYHAGAGGGGGSILAQEINVAPGASINIMVGAGGLSGNIKGDGGLGGASLFGNYIAYGGEGGLAGTLDDNGVGGSGGEVVPSSAGVKGGGGGGRGGANPGVGGGTIFGSGGDGGDKNKYSRFGRDGNGYGGGGGGGPGSENANKRGAGGHGAPGFVLVEW